MRKKVILVRLVQVISVVALIQTHSVIALIIGFPLVLWLHFKTRIWTDDTFVTGLEKGQTSSRPEIAAARRGAEEGHRTLNLAIAALSLLMIVASVMVLTGWHAKQNIFAGSCGVIFFGGGALFLILLKEKSPRRPGDHLWLYVGASIMMALASAAVMFGIGGRSNIFMGTLGILFFGGGAIAMIVGRVRLRSNIPPETSNDRQVRKSNHL